MADSDGSAPGLMTGLVRAGASLVGVHLQHAHREASNDLGRVIAGIVLLVGGGLFAALAVLLGHAAAVWALHQYTVLDWLHAILAVAATDLVVALLLLQNGRARLRKPLLKETRELVRRTVATITQG